MNSIISRKIGIETHRYANIIVDVVQGDLLEAPEYYIIHQVNCRGVMGSGVAKQIRDKYPIVFKKYKEAIDTIEEDFHLGKIQFVDVERHKIVNMFTQFDYAKGITDTNRYTDYEYFYIALCTLRSEILKHNNPKTVAFPYKIGCCRGGADWDIIVTMIGKVFDNTGIEYKFYEYNKSDK